MTAVGVLGGASSWFGLDNFENGSAESHRLDPRIDKVLQVRQPKPGSAKACAQPPTAPVPLRPSACGVWVPKAAVAAARPARSAHVD